MLNIYANLDMTANMRGKVCKKQIILMCVSLVCAVFFGGCGSFQRVESAYPDLSGLEFLSQMPAIPEYEPKSEHSYCDKRLAWTELRTNEATGRAFAKRYYCFTETTDEVHPCYEDFYAGSEEPLQVVMTISCCPYESGEIPEERVEGHMETMPLH